MSRPRNQKVPKDIGPSSTFGTQNATAKGGVHFCKNPPLKVSDMFRSQKGVTKPKNRTNSTKDLSFLSNSRGLAGYYPVNKGFEASRTRKFTRKFTRTFGKIFVTQFLCGAFSVPNIWSPPEARCSRRIIASAGYFTISAEKKSAPLVVENIVETWRQGFAGTSPSPSLSQNM